MRTPLRNYTVPQHLPLTLISKRGEIEWLQDGNLSATGLLAVSMLIGRITGVIRN